MAWINTFTWPDLDELEEFKPPPGPEETEELDPETIKERLTTLKKYLPYLALVGVAFAVTHLRKNGLSKSVDLVALSNVIQAFTPLITAMGWVLFTKVNDTAKNLSFAFATAETIPAIDLNLPPGINLGSYFVVGDELLEMIPDARKWLEGAKEEGLGLAEQILAGIMGIIDPETPFEKLYKELGWIPKD